MKPRKIFNRIAILRQERQLSRKDLAERIGVNVQTVGYLEREEYNPSLDLALRICACFDMPVEMVFSVESLRPMSQELLEKIQGRKE